MRSNPLKVRAGALIREDASPLPNRLTANAQRAFAQLELIWARAGAGAGARAGAWARVGTGAGACARAGASAVWKLSSSPMVGLITDQPEVGKTLLLGHFGTFRDTSCAAAHAGRYTCRRSVRSHWRNANRGPSGEKFGSNAGFGVGNAGRWRHVNRRVGWSTFHGGVSAIGFFGCSRRLQPAREPNAQAEACGYSGTRSLHA